MTDTQVSIVEVPKGYDVWCKVDDPFDTPKMMVLGKIRYVTSAKKYMFKTTWLSKMEAEELEEVVDFLNKINN